MNSNSQKLIIFIALSGLILLGYNMFFMPKPPPAQTAGTEKSSAQEAASPESSYADSPSKTSAAIKKTDSSVKSLSEKKYFLENSLVKITFSNIGSVITEYKLKNYSDSDTENEEKEYLELIPNKSSYSYLSLSSPQYSLANTAWNYDGASGTGGTETISFTRSVSPGVSVTRKYSINEDSYLLKSDIIFSNQSAQAVAFSGIKLTWGPNIHFLPADVKQHKDGFYQYNKVVYPVSSKKVEKIDIKLNAKEDSTTGIKGSPPWISFKDLYFMSSFIFKSEKDYTELVIEQKQGGFAYLNAGLKDVLLNSGATETISVDSFIGPQEYKRLKKFGMERTVDLGWIRTLGVWMFYTLDFLHTVTKNYGFAILLLTFIIRMILWYPSHKSYKHMKETQQKMNIIKPRMETLKKVYKDDSQKMNEEVMKLYREYKINPFGGCLPMLLQLPIFIALYQTLINMVELKGASFIFWLKDLSRPDPFYVLPIFMGVSMFVQQKMSQAPSPTPEAASQQKIFMYGLPVFLTFLAFSWPSGLLLYWGMSNVLAIIQQVFVNKSK